MKYQHFHLPGRSPTKTTPGDSLDPLKKPSLFSAPPRPSRGAPRASRVPPSDPHGPTIDAQGPAGDPQHPLGTARETQGHTRPSRFGLDFEHLRPGSPFPACQGFPVPARPGFPSLVLLGLLVPDCPGFPTDSQGPPRNRQHTPGATLSIGPGGMRGAI